MIGNPPKIVLQAMNVVFSPTSIHSQMGPMGSPVLSSRVVGILSRWTLCGSSTFFGSYMSKIFIG
jgi:hypothetical protein